MIWYESISYFRRQWMLESKLRCGHLLHPSISFCKINVYLYITYFYCCNNI